MPRTPSSFRSEAVWFPSCSTGIRRLRFSEVVVLKANKLVKWAELYFLHSLFLIFVCLKVKLLCQLFFIYLLLLMLLTTPQKTNRNVVFIYICIYLLMYLLEVSTTASKTNCSSSCLCALTGGLSYDGGASWCPAHWDQTTADRTGEGAGLTGCPQTWIPGVGGSKLLLTFIKRLLRKMIFCFCFSTNFRMNYKIQRYSRLCVQFLETASDNFVSVSPEWEESPGFWLSGEWLTLHQQKVCSYCIHGQHWTVSEM